MSEGKRVQVRESARELAKYINEFPDEIDRDEYNIGQNFLAIYLNDQFNLTSDKTRELMIETILDAIEDLSTGADRLRAGMMGVQFYQNKVEKFVSTHEMPPLGTLMFRIAIKHLIAFQGWRTKEHDEIPQLQTNCAIYFLIVQLSQLDVE